MNGIWMPTIRKMLEMIDLSSITTIADLFLYRYSLKQSSKRITLVFQLAVAVDELYEPLGRSLLTSICM